MPTAIVRDSRRMADQSSVDFRQVGAYLPFSFGHRVARSLECLLRRAGGIDFGPVERAEVVALLVLCHGCVGIGGVAAAPADAGNAGFQIGDKEEALEWHPKCLR